jgi:hypothetical protein
MFPCHKSHGVISGLWPRNTGKTDDHALAKLVRAESNVLDLLRRHRVAARRHNIYPAVHQESGQLARKRENNEKDWGLRRKHDRIDLLYQDVKRHPSKRIGAHILARKCHFDIDVRCNGDFRSRAHEATFGPASGTPCLPTASRRAAHTSERNIGLGFAAVANNTHPNDVRLGFVLALGAYSFRLARRAYPLSGYFRRYRTVVYCECRGAKHQERRPRFLVDIEPFGYRTCVRYSSVTPALTTVAVSVTVRLWDAK